jgi:hypothetical protein
MVTNTSLVDTVPYVKNIRDCGSCSLNPDVYYNQNLCEGARGVWYPSVNSVVYEPFPAYNTVTFTCTVERGEGNVEPGTTWYREAGLFMYDGQMFARVVFPPVGKTNLNRLIARWSISF